MRRNQGRGREIEDGRWKRTLTRRSVAPSQRMGEGDLFDARVAELDPESSHAGGGASLSHPTGEGQGGFFLKILQNKQPRRSGAVQAI